MPSAHIDPAAERRDSPRVPMRLQVRKLGEEGAFHEYEGDLSLGGVAVPLAGPAHGRYEVLVPLPGQALRAQAEPVDPGAARHRLQLRFVDLDTPSELALARFLDDLATRPAASPAATPR